MRVGEITWVEDVKCNECDRTLKSSVDTGYGIALKHSESILVLCSYCYADLKKEMSEMWMHLK